MYGTIARLRVRAGAEEQLASWSRSAGTRPINGWLASYVYRADADPRELWLVVVFESREAYLVNAESDKQDAEYRRLRALLEADPEWHDGEVLFALEASAATGR